LQVAAVVGSMHEASAGFTKSTPQMRARFETHVTVEGGGTMYVAKYSLLSKTTIGPETRSPGKKAGLDAVSSGVGGATNDDVAGGVRGVAMYQLTKARSCAVVVLLDCTFSVIE
jgi:hypothetical protein